MTKKTVAERIADYGECLRFSDLGHDVVHEAKRRVIDSFACAIGAFLSPPVKAIRGLAPLVRDGAGATIIGGGMRTTPDFAAFANGVMTRYLDYNDTYLSKEPAHPSDNICAALAAAEASGRGGKDFITAIVAAYELQCALCDAASLRVRGWDHVAYCSFSSALAASMLLGLSREATVDALGIAGVQSPALRQTRAGELSMWKGCASANAARNSVFSCMLAAAGITGPAPVFEGEFGFLRLVSGPFELPPLAGSGADKRFKILDTYIKHYPAEYHAQSAIEAAIELSGVIGDIEAVGSVTVKTFGAAYEIIGHGPERWRPATRETADHSLPFCVASALKYGRVTLDTFTDDRLVDRRLLSLVDKVSVVKDAGLDRLYPEAVPNRVEVTLTSGELISKEVMYPKGHPKNPLTDKEVEEKFRALSGLYFSGAEAEGQLDALWRLDEAKDMGELLRLFSIRE